MRSSLAGFDLSVGSIMALAGCISGLLMANYGVNWFLACLIGVGVGLVCGAIVRLLHPRTGTSSRSSCPW